MAENNYKVFIPTAGIGARLGNITHNINKALISVGQKPVISHIIEKLEEDIEIVIALGFKGTYIKQYLQLVYPNRNFTFIEVDKFEGNGSGLGYTLNYCKDYLQSKFIFIANDTIITDEIPSLSKMKYNNWVGYSDIRAGKNYAGVDIKNGRVSNIYSKTEKPKSLAYIGVCGINDYKLFWENMDSKDSLKGENFAIEKMIKSGVDFDSIKFNWYDTGNIDRLQSAKNYFKEENSPVILEKEREAIWFINSKVVKFSIDKDFIKDRVIREKYLDNYIPKITSSSDNFYTYDFIDGNVLSKKVTGKRFEYLLSWLDNFWKPINLTKDERIQFKIQCEKFYIKKTLERLNLYYEKFYNKDVGEIVNDNKLPPLVEIFDKIDVEWLSNGKSTIFHGDLHFENIIINDTNDGLPFTLLDWRQNFGNSYKHGDIYYDLAKLYHGLIISHDFINQNYYSFYRDMNTVYYDFHRKNTNIECEKILKSYVENSNLDWKKVRVITALIFLNIAGLHHYPYCHLLYYLGRVMLSEEIR